MKKGITVFTPTFNREGYLTKLYNSLLNQKFNNFEWVIVDDGSTDGTKLIVGEFIKENKININYIYQKNEGKHIAFNNGVKNAQYELFMCIDSDDYLINDILGEIYNQWIGIKDKKKNLCGMIAYRGKNVNETMFGECFIHPYSFSRVKDEMKNGIFETTMVHKIDVLKKFPFPKFENENFITEDLVWRQIDQEYLYYVIPKVWTICSYLPTGLTNSINIFKFPKGEAEYFKVRYKYETKTKSKIMEYAKYLVFDKTKLPGIHGMIFYFPALILSYLYCFVWKKRFKLKDD